MAGSNPHEWTVSEFQYGDQRLIKNLNNVVQKNAQKFPNSDHVVTQEDVDAGIYDAEFLGANWIHGTLYSYCFVNNKVQEYSKWLVLGNDPDTAKKSMYHSIPERDKDGVLYSWCVPPDNDWQHEYDYMLVNAGYMKNFVPNIRITEKYPVPTEGTTDVYVLKCTVTNVNGKKNCVYDWEKQ